MDRNLGAMDIYYHGADHYGDLYYQFGRKDPFSGPRQIYIRNEGGDFPCVSWSTSTYTIKNTTADANCNNVPYSIKHPLTFIKGTYWTYNDIYNPTVYDSSIRWQDPYVKDDAGKSMFDPCPAGWKLTVQDVWNNMSTSNTVWNNPLPNCRNYFPGELGDKNFGNIAFPHNLALLDGNFYTVYTLIASCQPHTTSVIKHFLYGPDRFFKYNNDLSNRSYGMMVRCIQE